MSASVGERLREARKSKGMTQEDVARHLGVARTTVVAIERGDREPRPEELVALASLYGRPVNELLRESEPVQDFVAQFRINRNANDDEHSLRESIVQLEELVDDYAELERLTGLRSVPATHPMYPIDSVSLERSAESAAGSERSRLGLGEGPVLQLREVLENLVGLRVFALDLPGGVAAVFGRTSGEGGCIAFNANHPWERQRWSVAHEYAHFLTSRSRAEITSLARYVRVPDHERFADSFARHFLMPSTGVSRYFVDLKATRPDGVVVSDLLQMARYYEVSVQALILRLEDLRLIRAGTWERLHFQGFKVEEARRILDWAVRQPDTQLLPTRYIYLVSEAYERELISEGQLAHFLRTDRVHARAVVDQAGRLTTLNESGSQSEGRLSLTADGSLR